MDPYSLACEQTNHYFQKHLLEGYYFKNGQRKFSYTAWKNKYLEYLEIAEQQCSPLPLDEPRQEHPALGQLIP
jgi:hypothetical protein